MSAFACCGGSDEHPPEHTQDCAGPVCRLKAHAVGANGSNLCHPTPGVNPFHPEVPRTAVTCKRCLASLAKRDRAFQRKAREGIGRRMPWAAGLESCRAQASREEAARAIAHEEG